MLVLNLIVQVFKACFVLTKTKNGTDAYAVSAARFPALSGGQLGIMGIVQSHCEVKLFLFKEAVSLLNVPPILDLVRGKKKQKSLFDVRSGWLVTIKTDGT